MTHKMNIKQAVSFGAHKLSHLENSKLEAEVLLCSVMGPKWMRTLLKIKDDQVLTLQEQCIYRWRVYKRSKHIPTAYIIGRTEWNNLDIAVCPATLIPRDETETLCHHIKQNTSNSPSTILDVGTGSGCIAIALATHWPNAQTLGLDISRRALQYARYNTKVNHVNIDFKKSNLLTTIPNTTHFDLIVANLPYVPRDLVVTPEVAKEPRSAIFSGDDGLDLIRTLAQQIKTKSITFDQLWLEFLPESKEAIETIFNDFCVTFHHAINGEIFFAQITPRA